MDQYGSIIFGQVENVAPPRAGKRIVSNARVGSSEDNPLFFPGGGETHHSVYERAASRAPPAPPPLNRLAGRPSGRELPPRGPGALEPRHQYQHPTYHIDRSSSDTGAKELLYSSAGQTNKAAAQDDAAMQHPLGPLYKHLAEVVPALPRDAEGNADEEAVRATLESTGVELSADGFAELLARCDISPSGFPPFSDFMLCISRPQRPSPAAPSSQAHSELEPAPALMPAPAAASVQFAAQPPSSRGRQSAANGPDGMLSDEMMAQTWRHMQTQKQLQAGAFAPPGPVHGGPSRRDHELAQASAQAAHPVGYAAHLASSVGGSIAGAVSNSAELTLQSAVAQGTTARLGVEQPRPVPSFPLGNKSNVAALGNNVGSLYAKKRHVTSQKFTGSFPPDPFLY